LKDKNIKIKLINDKNIKIDNNSKLNNTKINNKNNIEIFKETPNTPKSDRSNKSNNAKENEKIYREIQTKNINVSFMINKDPDVIIKKFMTICKNKKIECKMINYKSLELNIKNNHSIIEICKVGKMKY